MDLEVRLAEFFHAPAALLCNSGYTANLALISALAQRGDTVLYDKAIHACVKDGARLSNARCLSFRHNDLTDLDRKLSRSTGDRIVVVESLYSMEGDYAPIHEIIEVCRKYQAAIIIDEAHTTGWAGPNGGGWAVEHQLEGHFLARVHTFGKAMGVYGACVVGSGELIRYLINFARPLIYTTALPPHAAVSIDCVLSFLEQNLGTNVLLKQGINYYLELASDLSIERSLNRDSPIQWIRTGGNLRTADISKGLQARGFDVRPILSPTVPEGRERLRICIHSFNTRDEIKGLIEAISNQS
jgi:8-amino-7-oxononanoate synthase